MKLKLFAIRDSKADYFMSIWTDQREASAIRNFSDAVNSSDPNNGFARHPEDYSLYLLGEFDNHTGEFDLHVPRSLVTASALKAVGSKQLELSDLNLNGKEETPVIN